MYLSERDIINKLRSEEYFYIENLTIVSSVWEGNKADLSRWKLGNYFASKEDAEEYLHFLIISTKLSNFAKANNQEIVRNGKKENFILCYLHNLDAIDVRPCLYENYGTICFSSEEIARAAVKEIGESELIKYFFKVRK